jgi:tRNA(fMet)-specific endonuclease VapC
MARYLLDTNIISFLVKTSGSPLHHRFRLAQASYLAISVITEAETRFGLTLMPPQAKLPKTMNEFLNNIEIEPWDSRSAQRYALLAATQRRHGMTLSMADTMIAAHALAHDFILVSNDKAFRQIKSLTVEDWTKGPQRA